MSSNNNDNTSTLKAAYDAVTGAAQNALGAVTGSTGDEAQGKAKQDQARAEHEASHATLKGPGFTASSSGAVTKDDPDRGQGSWDQTVGSAKEALGGVVGSESLKQSGREQNLAGQEQEARGQVNDLASGIYDRAAGTLGSVGTAITGDRTKQAEYERQHDEGKTTQRGVEHDLQKKAEAQQQ